MLYGYVDVELQLVHSITSLYPTTQLMKSDERFRILMN